MPAYFDLHNISEDQRIGLIGEAAMRGKKTAFLVDDIPDKIARYKNKLFTRFPALEILYEGHGPTSGSYTISVRLKKSHGEA